MTRFELNILGCGSATSTLRHLPSCQVLNVRDNLLMIDCGEGAQLEMRRMRLKFSRLNHIFISHLHGDHFFGLPGFLSTLSLLGKTGTLTIHTFADGKRLLQEWIDFFSRERTFNLEYNVIGTSSATIYEDDGITVRSFPLRHRVPCVGFRIDEKPKLRHIRPEAIDQYDIPRYAIQRLREGGEYVMSNGDVIPNDVLTTDADPCRSYAYCCDTAPSKRVVKAVEGADWIYHDATYGDDCARQARNRYHSTAREAAIVAREAGVHNLILGHFSSRYTNENDLLTQAREEFPSTIVATEQKLINLNQDIL